jgi:dienelactone hydrolase
VGGRTRIAGALVTALFAGCGGGGADRAPPATRPAGPDAVTACVRASRQWRSFPVRARGGPLSAAVIGKGGVGVVFANQSGNSACGWLPFAEREGRDRRVVVFEYRDQAAAAGELRAVARALHAAGTRSVAIVGASIGGRAVVQAAARDRGTVAAAISLSAERSVGRLQDILPDARRVRVPSLYVGSREDGYTNFGRETRELHGVTPAKVNQLLLVPGDDHGTDLLADASGPKVRAAIVAFLDANTG